MDAQILPIDNIYVPVKRRATLNEETVKTLALEILEEGQKVAAASSLVHAHPDARQGHVGFGVSGFGASVRAGRGAISNLDRSGFGHCNHVFRFSQAWRTVKVATPSRATSV